MPGELKVLTSRHLPELLALVDRDPVAHCFVASRLADPMDPWALGGLVWGWFEAGRLRSAMYTGANLIPIETTPAGPRVVRRQRPAAGPALLVAGRARRRGPGPVAPARARLGPRPRGALHAVPDGHRGPGRAPGPPRAAGPAHRRARPAHARGGRHVHRGGGDVAGGPRRRAGLPRPAGRDRPVRAGPGRGRGRAPDLQGRGRVGHRPGLPDPGGLGRPRPARPGAGRGRDGRRRRARPQRTSRRSSPCTSTTTTTWPSAPTCGSGSRRSARSRPSCSERRLAGSAASARRRWCGPRSPLRRRAGELGPWTGSAGT